MEPDVPIGLLSNPRYPFNPATRGVFLCPAASNRKPAAP
jgi:hypothetical protein